MKAGFTIASNGLAQGLEMARKRVPVAAGAAAYAIGNEVMTVSKGQTPVDTGAMRGSGYVTEPDVTGAKVTVEAGYGGPSDHYVVEQHENLSIQHRNGGAKFLEKAFDSESARAPAVAAQVAREVLERGGGLPVGVHPTRPS